MCNKYQLQKKPAQISYWIISNRVISELNMLRYIHNFVMLNSITNDPTPQGAIEQASHMLKQILSS
jgi:hypothetical protein